MAMERVDDGAFRQSAGLTTWIRQLRREVRMLRSLLPEGPLASSHCPICFRDFPHGEDAHKSDDYHMSGIEPSHRRHIETDG